MYLNSAYLVFILLEIQYKFTFGVKCFCFRFEQQQKALILFALKKKLQQNLSETCFQITSNSVSVNPPLKWSINPHWGVGA